MIQITRLNLEVLAFYLLGRTGLHHAPFPPATRPAAASAVIAPSVAASCGPSWGLRPASLSTSSAITWPSQIITPFAFVSRPQLSSCSPPVRNITCFNRNLHFHRRFFGALALHHYCADCIFRNFFSRQRPKERKVKDRLAVR